MLMPTKQELQQELEKLRKELAENRELMRQAAIKAEEMIALREQCEALKRELDQFTRGRRKSDRR